MIRHPITRSLRTALEHVRSGHLNALYRYLLFVISRSRVPDVATPLLIPQLAQRNNFPPLQEITDIIIPVYNGTEFLPRLFASILRNTNSPYRLIIIDDASPDPSVWPYLQKIAEEFSSAALIRNSENLGFVSTCNRGISLTRNHFVVLNTDVEVPPAWLQRLMSPIFADANVASVTPFSNAATICSFPKFVEDNVLLDGWSLDAIDQLFAHLVPIPIDIPTGVGFCMAFNRRVVEEIGAFDDDAFKGGYGEENDWCMRASARGYVHRMATNLFVYHKHGGSFLGERRSRLERVELPCACREISGLPEDHRKLCLS